MDKSVPPQSTYILSYVLGDYLSRATMIDEPPEITFKKTFMGFYILSQLLNLETPLKRKMEDVKN